MDDSLRTQRCGVSYVRRELALLLRIRNRLLGTPPRVAFAMLLVPEGIRQGDLGNPATQPLASSFQSQLEQQGLR